MSSIYGDAADLIAASREDWYGTDLFPPLPAEFDYALLDRWLTDTFGFRIDRLSADYYRRVLSMAERQLRDYAEEQAK